MTCFVCYHLASLVVFALVCVLSSALDDMGFSNVLSCLSIVLCCGVRRVSSRLILLFLFARFFGVALLYESPGGNQVDGLPPACSLRRLSVAHRNMTRTNCTIELDKLTQKESS